MDEAPPFAVIERRAAWGEPVRVFVNGRQVAEFEAIEDADAYAVALNDQRQAAECALKAGDPARYWRLRAEALDAELARTAADLADKSSAVLSRFFRDIHARDQKKRAARQPRLRAREPLKAKIQAAMHREKKSGLDFKTFMRRWESESIDGLYCGLLQDGGYAVEDLNEIEGRARRYTWGTLENYFSKS